MIKLRSTLVTDSDGRRIIRGELDMSTILSLRIDWYQRGTINKAKLTKLKKASFVGAEFPDIIIGVRGSDFQIDNGGGATILSDAYIVDGLQRWTATCLALEEAPSCPAHLGAKAFIPTDSAFERELFRKMNTGHTAMGASVMLRNEKEESRVAATLVGLSENEKKFALYRRIAWKQEADKTVDGDLVRGIVLLRVLGVLHHHLWHTAPIHSQVLALLAMIDRNIDVVGLQQARENLITFFDTIDEAWGIRDTIVRFGTTWLHDVWLRICARLFSDHREFWRSDDTEFFVPKALLRDLKRVHPNDPELVALLRGGKMQRELLYQTILNTLNFGKSHNRLVNRYDLQRAEEQASRHAYTGQTTTPS